MSDTTATTAAPVDGEWELDVRFAPDAAPERGGCASDDGCQATCPSSCISV